MGFCSCRCCSGFLVVLVAIVIGLMLESKNTYGALLKPYPDTKTFEEANENAYHFNRPSDGQILEYYVLGNKPIGAKVIVMFSGGLATGYSFCSRQPEKTMALAGDYTIICPTFPGSGTTAIRRYEKATHHEWIDAWMSDVYALLKSKKVKQVISMGISFGHEQAMLLGEYLLTKQNDIELMGISTGVPQVWASQSVELSTREDFKSGSTEAILMMFFLNEWTLPFAAKYLYPLMMPGAPEDDSVYQQISPQMWVESGMFSSLEDFEAFDSSTDGFLTLATKDMIEKTTEYTYFPVYIQSLICSNKDVQYNTNYDETFGAEKYDFPIHFHHGTKDITVPAGHKPFLEDKVRAAKFFNFEGNHCQYPWLEMVEKIISEVA